MKTFLNSSLNVRQQPNRPVLIVFSPKSFQFHLYIKAARQSSPSSAVCIFLKGSESLASAAPEPLPTLH